MVGSTGVGLSSKEVARRQDRGEVNEVKLRSSRSLYSIVRSNIFTLFNGILISAMVVVLIVGNWQDAIFGGVMIVNAIIGIFSEYRAKRSLDALAIVDAPRARVWRDNEIVDIPASEVVLDDVVEVKLGDQVPADGEILTVSGLSVDESMLSGESLPVLKQPGDTILAGTAVVSGHGSFHVNAVGDDLYAQTIAAQAKKFTLTTSEIQQGINKVLIVVSWMIIPVTALLVWSQMRVSEISGVFSWRAALVPAVAAIVGMIPQGLVLLTSINFALASAILARKGILVQELPAVEVLARVDQLCLDKTGTLTTGQIHVRRFEAIGGDLARGGTAGHSIDEGVSLVDPAALTALHRLCVERDNATASAIMDAFDRLSYTPTTVQGAMIPFSSARKWSAWNSPNGSWILGAPEIVMDSEHPLTQTASASVSQHAQRGRRVVALVHSAAPVQSTVGDETIELPAARQPVALVILEEELRPDASETLRYFKSQGVQVRVISGDNPVTVGALARAVGLMAPDGSAARLCDARTLPNDGDSEDFIAQVSAHDVFGRVTPEQKRAMVRALQAKEHTVAMTGDGVNDTLALKDADLGIALGSGSAATKAVAQLVLVDGRFSELPRVVGEGRRIIANMERVASLFLAKTTYAVVIAITAAAFAFTYPFLPRHMTYIDAFTIGIPAFFIALGANRRRYVPGFLRRTLNLALPSGLVLAITALGAFYLVGIGTVAGQTAATLTLMIGALWLLCVTARPLVAWRIALITLMLAGSLTGVLLPISRHFFSLELLTFNQWLIVGGFGVTACVLIELSLLVFHRSGHRKAEKAGAVCENPVDAK